MNAEELAAAVDELELKIERLRVLYDQYFTGIERIPPSVAQKDVDRRIWILRREKIRNTGTRFKFQTIIQRYNTFNSYWTRILREIENGTYKRDVLRARRRFGGTGARSPSMPAPMPSSMADLEPEEIELDPIELAEDGSIPPPPMARPMPPIGRPPMPRISAPPTRAPVSDDDDLDAMLASALGDRAKGPSAPPGPPARPPLAPPGPPARPALALPRPNAPPAPSRSPETARATTTTTTTTTTTRTTTAGAVTPRAATAAKPTEPRPAAEGDYRKVYAQYVEAKRRNGESTAGLTYETLAKSLRDTSERLKGKSGGRAIGFEVATKDGKTVLKPVVK